MKYGNASERNEGVLSMQIQCTPPDPRVVDLHNEISQVILKLEGTILYLKGVKGQSLC